MVERVQFNKEEFRSRFVVVLLFYCSKFSFGANQPPASLKYTILEFRSQWLQRLVSPKLKNISKNC